MKGNPITTFTGDNPSAARNALRPWKRALSASDSGPGPRRAKIDFLSVDRRSLQTAEPRWRRLGG